MEEPDRWRRQREPAAREDAGVLAQTRLQFQTSRSNLLSPTSDYNRRWLEYAKEFGEQDDVVVVVSGEDRQAILPVLDELAGRLAQEPKSLPLGLPQGRSGQAARPRGFITWTPKQLAEIEGFLDQAQPVLEGNWAALNVGGQLAWFAEQLDKRRSAAGDGGGAGGPGGPGAGPADAGGRAGPSRARTAPPGPKCPAPAALEQNSRRRLHPGQRRPGGHAPALAGQERERTTSPSTPTPSPPCGRSSPA